MKKISANKKKILVLASMVVLLVVAGTLNFVLNSNLPKQGGGTDGDVTTTFFSALRTTRESKRAEQMAYYKAIVNDETSSAEAISSAEQAMVALTKQIETELNLENIIMSNGYADAVVTLSDNAVHVTLNKAELEGIDLENVYQAIVDNTEYTVSQVTIIPYAEAQ